MKKIKLSKKGKAFVWLFIVIFFCVGLLLYFNLVVNPIIYSMSEAKVKSLTQKAVNNAVYEILNGGLIYDDLVTIETNTQGEVTTIQTNSLKINKLTRDLVISAQKNLEVISEEKVDIPIGTFTGMPIFVGRGGNVHIRLLPVGVVTCTFVSQFTTAGINQTNHRIYVNINSSVSVIIPTKNKTVTNTTQLLIAESIIIGSVPTTYLQSDNLDEMLNLVPA